MFVTPPVFKERKNQENQSVNSILTVGFSYFSTSHVFVNSKKTISAESVIMPPMSSAPRNIGTQCENIDLESASENVTMTKGLWLKGSLKKYFGLGVQVSDPLLNVVKWIAYITEVQWEIYF